MPEIRIHTQLSSARKAALISVIKNLEGSGQSAAKTSGYDTKRGWKRSSMIRKKPGQ
jgi:hypothetical protein